MTPKPSAQVDAFSGNIFKSDPPKPTSTTSLDLLNQISPVPTAVNMHKATVAPNTAPPHAKKRDAAVDSNVEQNPHLAKVDATSGIESSGEQCLRFIISALIGITIVIMAFFQFMALNPSYLLPDASLDRLLAPNSWELPLFVTFLQQIGTLALAQKPTKPLLFYSNFLDGLSWLSFLIHGGASSSSLSWTTLSTVGLVRHRRRFLSESHSKMSSESSHLSTDSDAVGYIQFSDRTHVRENEWFVRLWFAIVVVLSVLLLFVVITALISRWASHQRQRLHHHPFQSDMIMNSSESHKRSMSLRSISRRFLSMCIVVVYMSMLPLTMMALFEIHRDGTTAGFPHATSVFAFITLLALVAAIMVGMFALFAKSEAALSKWQTKVVWGVVYSNYHYRARLFFSIPCLVQVLTGVMIACVTRDALTQMMSVIVLHALYVALLLVLQPCECRIHLLFAVAFEVLTIIVFSIACGMTTTGLTAMRQDGLSHAIVVLVSLVVICMFLRQLVLLWQYASGWAKVEDQTMSSMMLPVLTGPGVHSVDEIATHGGTTSGGYTFTPYAYADACVDNGRASLRHERMFHMGSDGALYLHDHPPHYHHHIRDHSMSPCNTIQLVETRQCP